MEDHGGFEGNAQTFHIVTKLASSTRTTTGSISVAERCWD